MKNCLISYLTKQRMFFLVTSLLLVVTIFLSLFLGAAKLSFNEVLEGLFNPNTINGRIVWVVRIPRIVGTILAGAALSLAGYVIQTILHNSLAGPNIIGVNSGALFFMVFGLSFFPSMTGVYAVIPAFIGALLACLIIYLISKKAGFSKVTLVLAGVAINALFQGAVDLLLELNPNVLPNSQSFRVGGANGITLNMILPFGIIIIISIIILLKISKKMDVLSLGIEVAKSIGLNPKIYMAIFLFLAALLAASAVSFMGLLGFIGLIVPHIVRYFIKNNSRSKMLGTIVLGALFLTLSDLLCRCVFAPFEIPVGIILSIVGGPFFIFLLIWRRNNDFN